MRRALRETSRYRGDNVRGNGLSMSESICVVTVQGIYKMCIRSMCGSSTVMMRVCMVVCNGDQQGQCATSEGKRARYRLQMEEENA